VTKLLASQITSRTHKQQNSHSLTKSVKPGLIIHTATNGF